jgi:hypothetical protein
MGYELNYACVCLTVQTLDAMSPIDAKVAMLESNFTLVSSIVEVC